MSTLAIETKAALATKAAREAAQKEAAQETLAKAATDAAHVAIEMMKNRSKSALTCQKTRFPRKPTLMEKFD